MNRDDSHPSQAEGEDPERPPTSAEKPQEGHPSQAEGEERGETDAANDGD